MKIEKCIKESFVVIGKEGSTLDGEDFIKKLWKDVYKHYEQVAYIAKKDRGGKAVGYWGMMSDFSRSFLPWKDFKEGLYLAGVECVDSADAPEGWVKWVIPGYEYLYVEFEDSNTFREVIKYMEENNIPLVGAAHDFICPNTGSTYLFFPIRKL